MLAGSVDNLLAKEWASEVAESVKGVRAVINDIVVRCVARPDREIQKDVQGALILDRTSQSFEITVDVKEGRVILGGVVDSWQKARIAGQIAKGVRGVKELKNEIEGRFEVDRSDREIKVDVERRLEWDVWVDAAFVNVDVQNGEVILTGAVGSAGEKGRTYGDALVSGVTSVDDSGLEVDWAVREKMQRARKYPPKSDHEIAKAVKDAFFYDHRLSSSNLEVQVNNGIVSLIGLIGGLKAKQVAEQDAKNTLGVWRVNNYLRVCREE